MALPLSAFAIERFHLFVVGALESLVAFALRKLASNDLLELAVVVPSSGVRYFLFRFVRTKYVVHGLEAVRFCGQLITSVNMWFTLNDKE